MRPSETRSVKNYLLKILMLFQGISGMFGGSNLVLDPSGQSLGLPVDWLSGTPFENYLLPGWILLVTLGVVPMVVFYGLWQNKRWSWYGSLMVSLGLITWIVVEIMMIGYHAYPPLQILYGFIGLVMLLITLLPGVKRSLRM